MLLTNAAGGIREDLSPGDIMVIDDHINAMGANPLQGPHATVWGERFTDQSEVYDRSLRQALEEAAVSMGLVLPHGVYLATGGPAYETPAEIRMFRAMGADAVGMSTVPEAMLGRAAGLRVCGISCITNRAAGTGCERLSHDDVIARVQTIQPQLKELLLGFLERLARE